MKVLLLNPPFKSGRFSRTSRSPAITKSGTIYYPIWLAYATGVLEKAGFEVRLVDAPAQGLSEEDCIRVAKRFEPGLVVVDTSTPSIYNDVETAAAIKKEIPYTFTVLVGTHPSALPEETLRLSEEIDAVCVGEYDYTIRELAKALSSGGELARVSGITFRDGLNLVHNEKRPLIEDLDELPFVSSVYKRHLHVNDYFFAASFYPIVMLVTGRGCPYRCSFCLYPQVFHSREYRVRSADSVADEFEYIAKELPEVREIGIEDDTFTVDKERVEKICEMFLKKDIKLSWYANARADLDFDTMKAMKKAGCRLLIVGFESGSQEILDNLHKGIKIEDMIRFNEDARRAGLLIHGCFIIGNPGETKETIFETIKLAKRLRCDTAQFFPLMIYPGTEAYRWAEEKGYIISKDFSKWVTEEGLHNAVLNTESLSAKELVDSCNRARREFYLRPSYISYKFSRALMDPREFVKIIKSFMTFYRHLF